MENPIANLNIAHTARSEMAMSTTVLVLAESVPTASSVASASNLQAVVSTNL